MTTSVLHHGSAGTGPPTLVFLHAGVADSRMWDALVASLTPDCRAIWCDLRGFGRTPSSAEAFAHGDDVTALVRSETDGPVWLVGASLGARVAVDLALAGHLSLQGLILLAPAVSGMSFDDDVSASWDTIDAFLDAGRVDGAVDEELRLWVVGAGRTIGAVDPAVIELARDMIRTNNSHEDHDTEVRPTLKAVTALESLVLPTLVVVGAEDRHEVRALAAEMEARMPRVEHHVIPDAAHLVALERAAVVADLVSAFVARHGEVTAGS